MSCNNVLVKINVRQNYIKDICIKKKKWYQVGLKYLWVVFTKLGIWNVIV